MKNNQIIVPSGSLGHVRLTHWNGGGGALHFRKLSLNKQLHQYDIKLSS